MLYFSIRCCNPLLIRGHLLLSIGCLEEHACSGLDPPLPPSEGTVLEKPCDSFLFLRAVYNGEGVNIRFLSNFRKIWSPGIEEKSIANIIIYFLTLFLGTQIIFGQYTTL